MLQRIARLPAWVYVGAILLAAVATVVVVLLLENIAQRQQEARQTSFRVVELTEDTEDPAIWGQNFPRQYDGYKRTVDIERTRYGGSEDFSKLDADPLWKTIFNGYPFGVDYREERGHAYMLLDQRNTERVKLFNKISWLWVGTFLLRLAVQLPLYLSGALVALGIAKTAMGLPIFALAIYLSYLMLKAAGIDLQQKKEAEEAG